MFIKPYDVFFENDSIWVSYRLFPMEESYESIKCWLKFDKEESDLISDLVFHKEFIVILMEHASNEVTFEKINKQVTDFHYWFNEFQDNSIPNPLDKLVIN